MIILCFQEAFKNRYVSGSTATVVLLVDGQILVAWLGDSKAVLCSKEIKNALGNEGLLCPALIMSLHDWTHVHLALFD